jgi:methionyl-tRNA formyltransferase
MVQKLDAGPILSQVMTPIEDRETLTSLQDRLAKVGADLLVYTLKKPLEETQQDEAASKQCHKLSRSTGDVDLGALTAQEVDRHVRALVPWPGVRVHLEGQKIKLIETALVATEDSIPVQCRDSQLHIVTLQPPGKKPMSGQAWHRGRS